MLGSEDTIAALATPPGEAALALIRVSGPEVPHLVRQIFAADSRLGYRKACLREYVDIEGTIIDQLVVIQYLKPNTFTGEDLLELCPHGNPFIVRRILEDLRRRGCRAAEPGEFARRAFLHGRMDLSQAEAIMDLIRARSDRALSVARRQLDGSVGRAISSLSEDLIKLIAHLEAYIDFPEEDLPPEDHAGPVQDLARLCREMGRLIATQRYGTLLRDGIRAVLLGEPNAGKSSLMNALVGVERAIVSPEPGTTRDYVEESLALGPYPLKLIDTAGVRDAQGAIELAGIERTLRQLQQADVVLLVQDRSTSPTPLPADFSAAMADKPVLLVLNKSDLPSIEAASQTTPSHAARVEVSCLTGEGLPALRDALRRLVEQGLEIPDEERVIVSARHAEALEEACTALEVARERLQTGLAAELVATDLRLALEALGRITGRIDNERVLDSLFARFCIGK